MGVRIDGSNKYTWIVKINPSGKQMYRDKKTGHQSRVGYDENKKIKDNTVKWDK